MPTFVISHLERASFGLRAHGWQAGAGYQPGQPNFAALQAWNAGPGVRARDRDRRSADRWGWGVRARPQLQAEAPPGASLAYDAPCTDCGNAHKFAKSVAAYHADARAALAWVDCTGRLAMLNRYRNRR